MTPIWTSNISCAGRAQRELAAVADTDPDADWRWATQAADALVSMQNLVTKAIAADTDTVDRPRWQRRSSSTAAPRRSASTRPRPDRARSCVSTTRSQ
jgi:hypothetical protein